MEIDREIISRVILPLPPSQEVQLSIIDEVCAQIGYVLVNCL